MQLNELYQDIIMDHGRHPRNHGALHDATSRKEGFNPLCGDRLFLYVKQKNQIIEKLTFEGCGCAISIASASLMSEVLQGKSQAESEAIFSAFHLLITTGECAAVLKDKAAKLEAFCGVFAFPARVKCATLAWHTFKAAITNDDGIVTTET